MPLKVHGFLVLIDCKPLTNTALQKQLEELQNEKFALSEEKDKLRFQLDQLKVRHTIPH